MVVQRQQLSPKRVNELLILLLCCCILRHVPSCMGVATAETYGPPACAPAFEVKLACWILDDRQNSTSHTGTYEAVCARTNEQT